MVGAEPISCTGRREGCSQWLQLATKSVIFSSIRVSLARIYNSPAGEHKEDRKCVEALAVYVSGARLPLLAIHQREDVAGVRFQLSV